MEQLYITNRGRKIPLSDADVDRIYKAKLHYLHVQAAKQRVLDEIDKWDQIRRNPWILSEDSVNDGSLDPLFDEMAETFEQKRNDAMTDNNTWVLVLEKCLSPVMCKNMADYIVDNLVPHVITSKQHWEAFVTLIQQYSLPKNDIEIDVIIQTVQQAGLLRMPHDPTGVMIPTIHSALAHAKSWFAVFTFCEEHLPPHPDARN